MEYSSPSNSPRLLHFRYAPTAGDHFHELDGKEQMAEGFNYGQNTFASHNSLNGEYQTAAKRHVSLSSPFGFSPENDDPRFFGGFYAPYPEGNSKRNQYSSIGKLLSYSQEHQQNGEFIEGGVNSEGVFHYQDAICKVRAKRGCATHPRSIAERVRRTRISERMRKLQELVPSLDKQTNTADMLDYAVDYIKDLQRQLETLSENRANCKCMPNKIPPQYHVR